MADTNVKIIVGLKDEFSRGISRFGNALEGVRRQVFSLQSALIGLGAGVVVKGFVDTAASMEKTKVLMEGLTKDSKKAEEEFQWLLKFGKDNAAVASLDTLQKAFVRLKVGGLDPTKGGLQALADGVAAFGGGTQEFERATVAIQQMLGKNAVNMEELRQQLGEAMPAAVKLMADGLGISVEQLNKLTEKAALVGSKSKLAIEAMFQQMKLEFSGSSEKMANTWNGLVARLNYAWEMFKYKVMKTDVFKFLKERLAAFVQFLDSPDGGALINEVANSIASGFLNAAKAVASLAEKLAYVVENLALLVRKWNDLPETFKGAIVGGVVTKSPWGALAGAATGVKDDANSIGDAFANWFSNTFDKRFASDKGEQEQKKSPLGDFVLNLPKAVEKSKEDTEKAVNDWKATNAKGLKEIQDLAKNAMGDKKGEKTAHSAMLHFADAVRAVNKEFAELEGRHADVWMAEWADRYADLKTKILEYQKNSKGKVSQQEAQAALAKLDLIDQKTRAAISAGWKDLVQLEDAYKDFEQKYAALRSGDKKDDDRMKLQEWLDKLKAAGRISQSQSEDFFKLQSEEWDKQKRKENLETQRSFYQELMKISGEGYAVIEDSILHQAQVFKDAKISEADVAKWVEYQKLQYSREWSDGAIRGLKEYANAAMDASKGVEKLFTDMTSNMEDSLVEFVKTGKLNFSDLIDSMIEDLARLFIRTAILGPLMNAAGSAFGNMFGSWNGVNTTLGSGWTGSGAGAFGGRADGGNVWAGKAYKVGERGQEWFVPGMNGTIVPRQAFGNGGSGDVNVNIYNNTSSAKATANVRNDGNGGKSIEVIIDEMSGKNIAQPGSASERALRKSYNLRPTLTGR